MSLVANSDARPGAAASRGMINFIASIGQVMRIRYNHFEGGNRARFLRAQLPSYSGAIRTRPGPPPCYLEYRRKPLQPQEFFSRVAERPSETTAEVPAPREYSSAPPRHPTIKRICEKMGLSCRLEVDSGLGELPLLSLYGHSARKRSRTVGESIRPFSVSTALVAGFQALGHSSQLALLVFHVPMAAGLHEVVLLHGSAVARAFCAAICWTPPAVVAHATPEADSRRRRACGFVSGTPTSSEIQRDSIGRATRVKVITIFSASDAQNLKRREQYDEKDLRVLAELPMQGILQNLARILLTLMLIDMQKNTGPGGTRRAGLRSSKVGSSHSRVGVPGPEARETTNGSHPSPNPKAGRTPVTHIPSPSSCGEGYSTYVVVDPEPALDLGVAHADPEVAMCVLPGVVAGREELDPRRMQCCMAAREWLKYTNWSSVSRCIAESRSCETLQNEDTEQHTHTESARPTPVLLAHLLARQARWGRVSVELDAARAARTNSKDTKNIHRNGRASGPLATVFWVLFF
ncbi:hypothetical protein B0H11DRAFT_1904110 [Mycena galericulata]|nr:hypothetical protein B0H11DRAFT_1904110 [Mycena galericulata]